MEAPGVFVRQVRKRHSTAEKRLIVEEALEPGASEQIKLLLGHSSIQTTERYLESEQEIKIAVNDNMGL